jgi:hypothetical protein
LIASFCFITLTLHHYQLKYSYGKSNQRTAEPDSINKKVRLFQTELLANLPLPGNFDIKINYVTLKKNGSIEGFTWVTPFKENNFFAAKS